MPPDIVALAQARKVEIAKQMEILTAEAVQLDSFLDTARVLQARLAANAPPSNQDLAARKATKKDVVECALAQIRHRRGPVSTGDIVSALEEQGYQVGGGASSPSSVVSANLSAAPEIDRNPMGPGWVENANYAHTILGASP